MLNFTQLYYSLCSSRKQQKLLYKKYSGIHKHHIIPKHSGGKDDDENYTYLSVREHIIAHFLLWKMFRNINDLNSMHMLGAKLTTKQRKLIGEYARDNKIGFHKFTTEERKALHKKIWKENKEKLLTTNKWHNDSVEERKERAVKAGIISHKSGNNIKFRYWSSPEGRSKRSSLGGKTHVNKKAMYHPDNPLTFKRVKVKDIELYKSQGYIFGSPTTGNNKPRDQLPANARKVTDGNKIYESVRALAKEYNITPGAAVHRIKNSKKFNWNYVS